MTAEFDGAFGKPQGVHRRNYDTCDRQLSRNVVPTCPARQVDVLVSQGQNVVDAIRQIGVSEVTYYRWRQEFGGVTAEQVKRLKDLAGDFRSRHSGASAAVKPDKGHHRTKWGDQGIFRDAQ